jgi:peroxiredoxin
MNRSIIALIAASLTLASCESGPAKRAITLSVEGAGGKTVYFDRFENNLPYHVDSVKLDAQGKGVLKTIGLPLDFYRIGLDNEQLIVALDSAEELSIEAKVGSLAQPIKASGSVHTDALLKFYSDARAYDAQREALRAKISATPGDTASIKAFNAINAAFHEQCKQFVLEHSNTPASLTAVNKLSMQDEFELFKKVRNDLRPVMGRSSFFAMFRDQVDRIEQQEIQMKMQEEEMKRLSNLLPIGSEAPEIRQDKPEGGSFALSDLRGKIVLIDFWASWCRPCRMENPNVKRVYDRFNKKGFEILGVSLDRDHAAWVKAIQDDGLPWKHVSDLGFWNNAAAQEYGVTGIPYTVLVDREGKILDKGLRGEQLEQKLAELLGK